MIYDPWTPVCEKKEQLIANPGFNAKVSTIVLPRRQFLPASFFCASTTGAIPCCYILPRVVLRNVARWSCCYLRPPLMMALTTPRNAIWVVVVTTMAAFNLKCHHKNQQHRSSTVSPPLPTDPTIPSYIHMTLRICARSAGTASTQASWP